MPSLFSWLDDRTGYKGFVQAALYEHIPGGARWRYVWGSTLMFALAVQMVTGLFLWMHYSPSAQTAWESVYYIQHEMSGGWLLRGIHHYTAQVMIVLLALHMLQVIIDGAYRAPREINFWIGLVLLNLVLATALTGYLLPWDQRGYWSTSVATNLINLVPGVGPHIRSVVIGGAGYGHHTLTRFFAVHAGLLPFLMMGFIGAHVYLFRRHGLRYKEPKRGPDAYFWADQVLKDAVACLGVLLVVLLLCVKHGLGVGYDNPGELGAPLSAPADPSEPFGAARPEWYFLFLFQFLKLPAFAAEAEVFGAIVVPGAVMVLLFLMPLIGRWKAGHWFNVLLITALSAGVVLLTTMALVEDAGRPDLRVPLLGRLGLGFATVWAVLIALGVIVLVPMIGHERNYRRSLAVLGGLVVGVLVAVLVVAAGGGTGAADHWGQHIYPGVLYATLALLVLLVTIVLLKSPSRTSGRMAADRAVTAAADAEAADAALTNTTGGDDLAAPGDIADGSWIRRWELHHRARLALLLLVLGGVVTLSAIHAVGGAATQDKRVAYAASVEAAERDARRVVALARGPGGIPPQGAVWLLRNDALTQGPRLFSRHCASCHRYEGHDGLGAPVKDVQSAPDLKDFASRVWLAELLDPKQVDSVRYFGPHMKAHEGKMVQFVKETVAESIEEPEDKADLGKIVAALAAEAKLPRHREEDARDVVRIAEGREAMTESAFECTDCHNFHDKKASLGGRNRGPDLTGYGSRQWQIDFIRNPAHPRFYGERNDRMPLYGEQKVLDDRQIGMIVDWLRGDVDGESEAEAMAPAATAPAATAPAVESSAVTRPAETKPADVPVTAPAPATAPEPATAPAKAEEKKPDPKALESEFD